MPRAGNGNCRPRPTACINCEGKSCDGNSGSGPVGGGEGGGRSSKKRGRGLGTMKSEDETIDESDKAGDALCRGGNVEGDNMSGDGVARGVRDRKSCGSVGGSMGEGVCTTGEGRTELGLKLCDGEAICGEVFGCRGSNSGVITTAGGDGRLDNVMSDEPKGLEGAKRTPY